MTYLVKRIVLKDGRLLTERELDARAYTFGGPAPFVGEKVQIKHDGRPFVAEVIWGNWPDRPVERDPSEIVPIRVKEV